MPKQLPHMMGASPKILRVFKEIKKISLKDTAVLISGEKGSCTELVAKAIHDNSRRREGPFVRVNLASLPKEYAGEELFGHRSDGPAADAQTKNGRVGEANGGTLLLDEIAELDTDLQKKLLGFLCGEEPGSTDRQSPVRSDVRVVCATSKNLKEIVEKGMFNANLYDMLKSTHIKMPSLRERKEDILPLAQSFLDETAEKFETGAKELSKEAKDFLMKYSWPGDMRQLEEMIKRAALLSSGETVEKKDLLLGDVHSCSIKEFLEEKLNRYLKEMTQLDNCNLFDTVLSEVEKALITIVLKETGGNQVKAARTLGINRNTLRAKVKEYKVRL
jgi:DNA-binding NtrC family response regulator